MKRKGSNNHYFSKRIPSDIAERMIGLRLDIPIGDKNYSYPITKKTQTIRISLRASEPNTVRTRQAALIGYLEQLFDAIRANSPVALTHRHTVVLSKAVYDAWSADPNPSNSLALELNEDGEWERVSTSIYELGVALEQTASRLTTMSERSDTDEIESIIGAIIDKVLLQNGIAQVDDDSRGMLRTEFLRALQDGMALQAGKALRADYSSPRREFPNQSSSSPTPNATLQGLVDRWWNEAKRGSRSESTLDAYKRIFRFFGEHTGIEDATQVTQGHVISFKEHRLSNGISPRTFRDGDLSGLKSVFGWAVDNNLLLSNPARGVKVVVGKKVLLREEYFKSDEISQLLMAANTTERSPRESIQRWAGRRWVPWILAYSGARVGEIIQLRKEDFSLQDEHQVFNITPEAGRVKDGDARLVPLHPHLIEMGLLEHVQSSEAGQLFMWTGNERPAWRTAKNNLRTFVRTIITDPNVSPNHGWRYTFKTLGLEAGIEGRILDDICGHEPDTIGRAYSPSTLKTKADAIRKLPNYLTERKGTNDHEQNTD